MTTEQKMNDAHLVRELVEVAGMQIETALSPLEAVSEAQRDYAAWVRVEALAGIWEDRIKSPSKNQKMAVSLINAANTHAEARWWLDRASHLIPRGSFIDDLRDAIKKEMSR